MFCEVRLFKIMVYPITYETIASAVSKEARGVVKTANQATDKTLKTIPRAVAVIGLIAPVTRLRP